MKYGIKLRATIGAGGTFLPSTARATISEFEGPGSVKLLEFESIGDAEVYAQNHEIKNYTIEPIPEKSAIPGR
jgi:hypothetical protein